MNLNHHILLAMITLAIREIQDWTKESLPDEVLTTHDFNDGHGQVSAIPLDRGTMGDMPNQCIVNPFPYSRGDLNDTPVMLAINPFPLDTDTMSDTPISFMENMMPMDMCGMCDQPVSFMEV